MPSPEPICGLQGCQGSLAMGYGLACLPHLGGGGAALRIILRLPWSDGR